MRDCVGQRVAEQQAQRRDRQADQEGPAEEPQVDPLLLRLADDAAVRPAVPVDGVQVVAGRPALAGAPQRPPRARLSPGRVGFHHGRAPVVGLHALQPAHAAGEDAAQAGLHAVDAGGDLAERPLLPRGQQLAGRRREHRRRRRLAAVPAAQQCQRLRHRICDHGVVDAAHQHRPQRSQERHADEPCQRQDQQRGAEAGAAGSGHARPGPVQRASHAPKRSLISSP